MSVLRFIEFQYDIYRSNPNHNTYYFYKDFIKVPSDYHVRDRLFNILYLNLDNKEHKYVKKFHRIVKYMKRYKRNFNDEYRLLCHDIDKLQNIRININDFNTYYDLSLETTKMLCNNISLISINRIKDNLLISVENKKTYDEIITENNNRYSGSSDNKKILAKLKALNEISNYLTEQYFTIHSIPNIFTYKYGQDIAHLSFVNALRKSRYWGIIVAPTGWGKSMMNYIFMGEFFRNSNKNILLLTKRKDILNDINNVIKSEITKLQNYNTIITDIEELKGRDNMFPNINYEICYCLDKLDIKEINRHTSNTIFIINTDKLITRNKNDNTFDSKTMDKIHWRNFGLVMFDEVHWAGSNRNTQFMNYLKKEIKYGIGCSATPIRKNSQNQANIQELFGNPSAQQANKYNIMYELSYKKAWEHNVILKIDTVMFPIYRETSDIKDRKDRKDINTNYIYDVKSDTKQTIIGTINKYLDISYKKKVIMFFRNRLSLLQWYKYFNVNNSFDNMSYHMSITFDISSYNNDTEEEKKTTNKEVNKMIKKLKLDTDNIEKGISNFKNTENNAILMVVNRANEGFNDPPVDICVNMDFTKNSNMSVSLQRMGRAQRLCGDKKKGYYICPVLSETSEEFKNQLAHTIYDYIDATTTNRVNNSEWKSNTSKEIMTYIIDSFITEGNFDYTHDDLMKRILRFEKERDMTLDQFINKLNVYNITDSKKYNEIWSNDEKFRDEGMPEFISKISDFSWDLIKTNNFYDEKEIIDVLYSIYNDNILELEDIICDDEKLDYLHNIDNRIPNITLWTHYNKLSKQDFSFIFT
jgi:superfamily II DNA or RNA helicase